MATVKNEVATQNTQLAIEKEMGLVEYEANGEMIKLSFPTVRKYLVSGGGNVSDQEVMMFLTLCRYQHLNPFLREAYLIKYGSNDPATIVTGKDVFTKRADATPNYAGKQAGVIVLSESGEVIEREGSFVLPKETLVGGWAKVFIKGHDTPEYAAVSLEEYIGRKKDGTVNSQWSKKPATMIRKVAVVQALREAFPDRFQGMYAQEEMAEVSDIRLDTQEIVANEIAENANTIPFEEAPQIEEKPTMPPTTTKQAEKALEPTEGKQTEIPDFMKSE